MSVYVTGAPNLGIGAKVVERAHCGLYVAFAGCKRQLPLETFRSLSVLFAVLRE
jgi:hypothetical protein